MLVIYTSRVTNRLKYTLDFVFNQYYGMAYEITDIPVISVVPDNFYINYSKNTHPSFFNIYQHDLLLENKILMQEIIVSGESEMPVFFQSPHGFDLPFDIFSCIFFLLSRYEEYLPHDKDMHGRYKSSNSLLAESEFDFSPIVETWLLYFKEELLKINPKFSFNHYTFEYTPTFDIDNAYRYLGRNWLKHPTNLFDVNCLSVLLTKQKDPYDVYDSILQEMNTLQLTPIFFFLLSDTENDDSHVSPSSKHLYSLINKFKEQDIGIHPSYLSLEHNLIREEKDKLEKISNRTVTLSRQHFLRISFPDYYRKLQEEGIQTDFSLCYPDVSGFRAGCSRPFYFYDLAYDVTTTLLIQPACWMDATFAYYPSEKNNNIQQNFLTIFNQLKKINGKLVPIFHNDLLAFEKYWGIFGFIHQQLNLRE